MASLKATIAAAGTRLGLKPVNAGRSWIGVLDGFPVQLTFEHVGRSERIVEVVRVGDAGRNVEIRDAILMSEGPVPFRANRLTVGNGLVVHQHARKMFRSASADKVVAEIQALVQGAKRAVPLPASACRTCASATAIEPMLVDGIVDRLCASCVQRLQHQAKVASDRYDTLPLNLSLAVPAAAVLALVSAVAWAALAVATNRMFWIAAVGIGALIGWGTTRAAGKGGLAVQILSAVFTVVAVLLGQILFVAWLVNRHARSEGMEIDWKAFAAGVPSILAEGGSDTVFAVIASLVGAFYAIKRAGKPRLEVTVEQPR